MTPNAAASQVQWAGFHGRGLRLETQDPLLMAALASRLRELLEPEPPGLPCLSFRFVPVASLAESPVRPPQGALRRLLDLPGGLAGYDPVSDRIYARHGDLGELSADPRSGEVLAAYQPSGPGRWLASHFLFTLPFLEQQKRAGRFSLHGSSLSLDGKGVIFAGQSGCGKSTLTVALLRANLCRDGNGGTAEPCAQPGARASYGSPRVGFQGDDTFFLEQAADGIHSLAFPEEIDVTEQTARWVPELRGLLETPLPPGWPKRQAHARDVFGARIEWRLRPSLLLFPHISHRPNSEAHPLTRAEALSALAHNVLLTEPRATQAHLDALGCLVRQCACYRLETGTDLDALPEFLLGLAGGG
ncbi:MAG TPA: hypothetical protein VGN26_15770, partial [Armatimonadota bacterium]